MSRATLVISNDLVRQKAINWLCSKNLPWGTRLEFKAPKRSLPQNDKMWAMLTEVADQARYHGVKLACDDWKLIFLDGLKRAKQQELRFVPNLDGTGFVNLSTSSSDLSKDEMGELIELIHAWGAQNGVTFADEERKFG